MFINDHAIQPSTITFSLMGKNSYFRSMLRVEVCIIQTFLKDFKIKAILTCCKNILSFPDVQKRFGALQIHMATRVNIIGTT